MPNLTTLCWIMDLIIIPRPVPLLLEGDFPDLLASETGTFKLISKSIEDKGFSGTKRYFGDLSKTVSLPSSTFQFDRVAVLVHQMVLFAVKKCWIQYTFCCSD